MVAIPDKDGKLLVGYFDYLNKKEKKMSTDPKDGGPTTESREEKRVEVPQPLVEPGVKVTETVFEPVEPHSNS